MDGIPVNNDHPGASEAKGRSSPSDELTDLLEEITRVLDLKGNYSSAKSGVNIIPERGY